MTKLKGIGVSPGIAFGPVYRLPDLRQFVPDTPLRSEEVQPEIGRWQKALAETESELRKIRAQIARSSDARNAEIFNVELLFLQDKDLQEQILNNIRKGINAARAVQLVVHQYLDPLVKVKNSYLKERRFDLEDVGKRLVRNLLGLKGFLSEIKEKKVVLVAYNLSPSETATLDREMVSAFATDVGGPTSHTAIMARALEIPAVVGLKNLTGLVNSGETIIVDGQEGVVIVAPDEITVKIYSRRQNDFQRVHRSLAPMKNVVARTTDRHRIKIGANIELPNEVNSVLAHGADEIGLFRTEFLYLNRDDPPSEEEQFKVYRHVVEKVHPLPVTIRTLDLGGDKFSSALDIPEEVNPFLGWRAIRFCLSRPKIFRAQLRAILRASAYGKVRLMYPLISDVEEIIAANGLLQEAKKQLSNEGKRFDREIPVGAMIEVPSAALTARTIARHVDFFSIGTNDLVQYSMAVDRTNERTAYLYNPAHPAILCLIKEVVSAARAAGIWVGICGEMAADPAMAFLLMGMGITELSMAPLAIPEVKQMAVSVSFKEASEFARKILRLDSTVEIADLLKKQYSRIRVANNPTKTLGVEDD